MDMSEMFFHSLKGNIVSKMDKILGKAVLIKPILDKLKIVSIIEKETMEEIENLEESSIELLFKLTGIDLNVCPCCTKGKMVRQGKLQPKNFSPHKTAKKIS